MEYNFPRQSFGDSEESFRDKQGALLAAVERADQWELYEGLPGQWEAKGLLENERKTKPVLLLDDNWFYLRAQEVSAGDRRELSQLFARGLFKPWGGTKFCGGFHGDYAVSFKSGETIHVVIFCLGCHEARILNMPAADNESAPKTILRLTVDLADGHYGKVRTLLLKYRKERPLPPPRNTIPMPPIPPPVPVRF